MVEILDKMVGAQELQQALVVFFGQQHSFCTTAIGLGFALAERLAEDQKRAQQLMGHSGAEKRPV